MTAYEDGYKNGKADAFLNIRLTNPPKQTLNTYGEEYYRGYKDGLAQSGPGAVLYNVMVWLENERYGHHVEDCNVDRATHIYNTMCARLGTGLPCVVKVQLLRKTFNGGYEKIEEMEY